MDWSWQYFYQGPDGILRMIVVGTLTYAALVIALRVSGKRTLAKLNAFDLVITVALGSTLATILLSNDVALVEGVIGLFLLIFLQYVVTGLSIRSPRFASLVRSEPTLLARDGVLCDEAMRRARVTKDELETVLRSSGNGDLGQVSAVILESDGSFSVLASDGGGAHGAT